MKQKTFSFHAQFTQTVSISTGVLLIFAGAAHAQTNTAPTPVAAPSAIQATDISQIPGVRITKIKDVVTGISIKDCQVLTPADYQLIRQTESLTTLGLGPGLNDAAIKILSGMPSVEHISTDGMRISDEGLALFATFKNLRSLSFSHSGKDFPGTGFAALAGLPNFESITVAGTSLGDSGMAAISKLSHLKAFHTWHTEVTTEGVKALGSLKELTTLTIGQRVTVKPRTTLNDDTIAVLATFSSLESISVKEARLSLPALSKLSQLPKLKILTLDDIEIPESDITTLKQQLPNVQIKWTAPNEIVRKRIDNMFGPVDAVPTPAVPTAPSPANATSGN